MATLYMTIGLPASGKSTLYETKYKEFVHNYIGSDDIREKVFGDVNNQDHNTEVFEIMKKRTIFALKNGESVYYDATNLSAKRRIAFLRTIPKGVERVALLVVPPLTTIFKQQEGRERKVPIKAIERMLTYFEPPHKSEGWDRIEIYGVESNFPQLGNIVRDLTLVPHDNPHHNLTIGQHMAAAYTYLYLKDNFCPKKEEVLTATLFHDIGKGFTKTFFDFKTSKKTDVAHYPNHANVGAYFYLCYSYGTEKDLYIANLIQHHMDFFSNENYLKKIFTRYGQEFEQDLRVLHEADINAHENIK